MSNIVAFVSLAGAVLFSIWVGYEIKTMLTGRRKVRIGSGHFDSDLYLTHDLGKIKPILTMCNKELWLMGISLHQFAVTERGAINRLLKSKPVDVRFLLLTPKRPESKEPDLVGLYVQAGGSSRTVDNIAESLDELKKLRKEYGERVQVRQHSSLPFHSMIIVDDSFIQVGFYLYSTDKRKMGPPDRPQAIVSEKLHPDIFKNLLNSYETVWDLAEPV